MHATEGAFVWNYTVRGCDEEELEELYQGPLGIVSPGNGHSLDSIVVANDPRQRQRAWLRLRRRVTYMWSENEADPSLTCVRGMG
jgi:hypothetical protein